MGSALSFAFAIRRRRRFCWRRKSPYPLPPPPLLHAHPHPRRMVPLSFNRRPAIFWVPGIIAACLNIKFAQAASDQWLYCKL
jgi:hypothetical protein